MPSTPRRRRTLLATAALVALGVPALSGCGGASSEPSADRSTSAQSSPTTSDSPSPTATVTVTTTPTPTPTPSPSATGPTSVFLGAGEVPRLDDSAAWTQKPDRPAGTDPFGLCQRFDLMTIGAEKVGQRTFADTEGDTAAQQVAAFPDAQNAVRTSKVLEAWHQRCTGQVPGANGKVGPIIGVPVTPGTGWRYQVTYAQGGQQHVHRFGLVLHGTTMSLLTLDHVGPARTEAAGKDPMELAVKAVASRIA